MTALLGLVVLALTMPGAYKRAGELAAIPAGAADPREPALGAEHSDSAVAPHTSTAQREALLHVDPSVAATSDGRAIELKIVRAESGAEAPGATVWWWPGAVSVDGDDGIEGWLRTGTLDEHLSFAVQLTADSEGRVRVPDDDLGFVAIAALGGDWGYASFPARRDEAALLAIAPDFDLRAQVVDPSGAPVSGIPVVLRQHRLLETTDYMGARTTAPDGIAILQHAGRFLRSRADAGFVVGVPGLFEEPPEARLDANNSRVMRLVLAPSGSCEVLVMDSDGDPVIGAIEARLRFDDSSSGNGPAHQETLRSRSSDRVVFEHVQLGRSLAVRVTREASTTILSARAPGPAKPGERIQIRVQLGRDIVLLRGRLTDAGGTPVRNLRVRACFETALTRQLIGESWTLCTSDDGRFTVEAQPDSDPEQGRNLALVRVSDRGAEIGVARRRVPDELTAGSHELGDFVLTGAPVAAAGIVVDREGRAISGASVSLSAVISASELESSTRACSLGPIRTDTQGRFEIRGEISAANVTLLAEKQGLVGDPVVVESGARDAKLVLEAAGRIEGLVLLDESLRGSMLIVQAARTDATPAGPWAADPKPAVIAKDGRFVLANLQPGTYSAKILHAATGSELCAVENLVVLTGASTRDPRLDPLDLRAPFRLIELEPVDENGLAVPGARAMGRPSGVADARWLGSTPENGRLNLLCDGRPLDIEISAAGFLHCEIEAVNSPRRVTLLRAANLRFELMAGTTLPEKPVRLGLRLTAQDSAAGSAFANVQMREFDEHGVLSCQLEFSGQVLAEGFLALWDPVAPATVYLGPTSASLLSIESHGAEQRFEIRFDAAALESALRELRDQH